MINSNLFSQKIRFFLKLLAKERPLHMENILMNVDDKKRWMWKAMGPGDMARWIIIKCAWYHYEFHKWRRRMQRRSTNYKTSVPNKYSTLWGKIFKILMKFSNFYNKIVGVVWEEKKNVWHGNFEKTIMKTGTFWRGPWEVAKLHGGPWDGRLLNCMENFMERKQKQMKMITKDEVKSGF